MTYKFIIGDQTLPVYQAIDPDGAHLDAGGKSMPAITYKEDDDCIEVIVRGYNRYVLVRQYDGGKAEATLFARHTFNQPPAREPLPDIDIHEVLRAVRKVVGPQTPIPPSYKPGDYSLR